MGSTPSKSHENVTCSSAEIAAFVGSLGKNFKPYENAIRESEVNAKQLSSINDDDLEKLLDSLKVTNRLHRRKLISVCRKRLKKNVGGEADTSSTSSSSNASAVPYDPQNSFRSISSFHRKNPSQNNSWGGKSFQFGDDASVVGSVGGGSVASKGTVKSMPGQFENMCVASSFESLSLLVNMENQKRLLTLDNRPKEPPENKAAIVLTDVQGSTSLWEADPKAMRAALNLHDEIIRGLRADHGGYEIDTEGDAFFLAFHTAKDAVSFALNLQDALHKAPWQDDILSQPEACEIGDGRGLRVRVGIHFGPVTKRNNAVTGRLEYTGETLNRAREVEKLADGGQTLTTRSTFDAASISAQVKDVEDDVVKVFRNTSLSRSSQRAGSTQSLRSEVDSACQRLNAGRKKRRNSMKKSIGNLALDNPVAKSGKNRRRRAPSRSQSFSAAEATSRKNFEWSGGSVKAGGA